MTDLDRAPKYHQYETLRRNCCNYAGRYFQDFWLLNSHLSRKAAHKAAHKLAKSCLKSKKDYGRLMITIVKQAKAAYLIKTVVELKEHLVEVDGVTHFEEECETDSMGLLKGYLVKKSIKVNDSCNSLFWFQVWLGSDQANNTKKKDFAFLLKVRLSLAFSKTRLDQLHESGKGQVIAQVWKQHKERAAAKEREQKKRDAQFRLKLE